LKATARQLKKTLYDVKRDLLHAYLQAELRNPRIMVC